MTSDEKVDVWCAAREIHLRNPEYDPVALRTHREALEQFGLSGLQLVPPLRPMGPDRFPDALQQVRRTYLNYRGTGPGPMPPHKQWVWSQAVRLSRSPDTLPEALAWVEAARHEIGLSDEEIG